MYVCILPVLVSLCGLLCDQLPVAHHLSRSLYVYILGCCTTFIPSLFVLVGFLLYKFVDIGRNQDPLALDLNAYNTEGGNPRNPIAYNTPESFYECQPKNCPYEEFVDDEITGETYYYCGTEASLNNGSASCSIAQSTNIIENINDAGAVAQGFDVENVTESSESLFGSTSAFT